MPEGHITVEVAFAKPDEQYLESLHVPATATVEQAIRQSQVLERFPEIDLAEAKVGVFGKVARLGDMLNEGDRVEIYRPLIADPKAARRKRAEQGKVMKKGARAE